MGGLAAMGLHGFVVPATIPPFSLPTSKYSCPRLASVYSVSVSVCDCVVFLGFQIRCVSRVGNLGSPQRRHVQL